MPPLLAKVFLKEKPLVSTKGGDMKRFGFQDNKWWLLTFLFAVTSFSLALAYAAADEAQQGWQAPVDAAKVKSPIPSDKISIDAGKKIFTGKCLSCHGSLGKGDGPMFKVLKKKPQDLTSAQVQSQSDGALFWKITKGQTPMPTFGKSLTDKERWNVVNYIRTLSAK
jgi:mono/diheme cytochrome c family protein